MTPEETAAILQSTIDALELQTSTTSTILDTMDLMQAKIATLEARLHHLVEEAPRG